MRIGIPIPTSTDVPYNQRSWPAYANAISCSGGEPIKIDIALSAAEILALVRTCDGILLPGSPADVDPALYAAERDAATAPADPAREAADYLLLDHAAETGKPLLAICYGLQSLNVRHGGSLVQDLMPLPVNHEAGGKVAIAHAALIAPDSLLASMLTAAEAPASGDFLRLPVNTSHHQAVAAPGDGLRIVARCPDDGVIEALELDPASPMYHVDRTPPQTGGPLGEPDFSSAEQENAPNYPKTPTFFHAEQSRPRFLLGVQWHPERSYDISHASRALFDRLLFEARARSSRLSPSR
jgi:putative glutamine amidotransferase